MTITLSKLKQVSIMALVSLFALVGCGNEPKSVVVEGAGLSEVADYFGILIHKNEVPVKRIKLYKKWDEDDEPYFQLVFSNYTKAESDKNIEDGKPSGYALGFTLEQSALTTILSVLEEPVSKDLDLRSARAWGYFFTKYSENSEDINQGLYFKQYQSMLVMTGSYWTLGEQQVHIKVSDAPKLAKLLKTMLDEVNK